VGLGRENQAPEVTASGRSQSFHILECNNAKST